MSIGCQIDVRPVLTWSDMKDVTVTARNEQAATGWPLCHKGTGTVA